MFCQFVKSVTFSNNKISNKVFMEKLFDGYSKYMLPISDIEKPVLMNLSWIFLSLNDVDTKQKTISATFILELFWIDEYLKWNTSRESGVPSKLSINSDMIWFPDFFIGNNEGFLNFILPEDVKNVEVLNNGRVKAYPYGTFQVGVNLDIYKYPFDTQEFEFEFMSWTYYTHELVLNDVTYVNESEVVFPQFRGNGEWDLATWSRDYSPELMISNNNEDNNKSVQTISKVTYKLTLRRRWLYTILNLVAPVALTSLLNPLSFLLPVDSGERISLSNAVFLTLAVFFSIVNNSLPQTSEGVPIIVMYIGLQMLGSALTIAFTIISVACYHTNRDLSKNKLVLCLLCYLCRHGKAQILTNTNEEKSEGTDAEMVKLKEIGKECSRVIDKTCFLILILLNVSLLTMLIIIANSG